MPNVAQLRDNKKSATGQGITHHDSYDAGRGQCNRRFA